MPMLLWWGGSILVSAVGGWLTGFWGSDSIKMLTWGALIAAVLVAIFWVWVNQ